jgi:hypothetical protein
MGAVRRHNRQLVGSQAGGGGVWFWQSAFIGPRESTKPVVLAAAPILLRTTRLTRDPSIS